MTAYILHGGRLYRVRGINHDDSLDAYGPLTVNSEVPYMAPNARHVGTHAIRPDECQTATWHRGRRRWIAAGPYRRPSPQQLTLDGAA